MRSDSVIIFGASVLATAAIITSAHYFGNRSAAASVAGDFEAARQLTPTLDQAIGNVGVSVETPPARKNGVIKCHDSEVGRTPAPKEMKAPSLEMASHDFRYLIRSTCHGPVHSRCLNQFGEI